LRNNGAWRLSTERLATVTNVPSKSECRKCKQPIFWHLSTRTGKRYPTDSPDDRKAFHKCEGPAQPKPVEKAPLTPSYFLEATLEERVASLETQVARLTTAVKAVESRQPITAEDVGL